MAHALASHKLHANTLLARSYSKHHLNRNVDEEGCRIFIDKEGNTIKAMCADFGFRSGSGRLYEDHYGETPGGIFELAGFNASNAVANALAKLDRSLEEAKVLGPLEEPPAMSAFKTAEWQQINAKLQQLTLDNDAVVRREHARVSVEGELSTPWWVKLPFLALCWVLDTVYVNRPIPKFWVLETVARIPYFAYISILHLYESLGFWRAGAELRKVHFAEEWNEMHHLQIMESLGGDQLWFDRFLAEHAAVLYYWVLVGMYMLSPNLAYNFMQRVELHAMDTYAEFIDENKGLLQTIPPPMVAIHYYRNEDLYLFDEFQTHRKGNPRRPPCNNLLDVFQNIRDDESEHVKTMHACQQAPATKNAVSTNLTDSGRVPSKSD